MTMKRSLSFKDYEKKKLSKLDNENTMDYTKSLTSENVEKMDIDDEETALTNAENIKSAKEAQASKKEVANIEEENKLKKKTEGRSNNTNVDKPTEKPDWKKYKREKRSLRLRRKQQKRSIFETIQNIKIIWEKARYRTGSMEEREVYLKELLRFSETHLESMVYSHDTSRIVQWMLKNGTPEIQSTIINNLIKHVPKMLLSKYACMCVKQMLKQGNTEQHKIMINSLKGKTYALTKHSYAAKIMDLIYNNYASIEQQNGMMHELYGASSILCESPSVLSLSAVLNNSPNTKDIILAKTKYHIKKFVLKNNRSIETTLVHNLIYEYVLYTEGKDCEEIFTALKEFPIGVFYTSKSGCNLAMYIIWSSNPKEKKAILKQIKTTGATLDLATTEYGYLILLALFDSVDDTVLVKQTIIPDILKNMDEIAMDEYGRRVLFYLIAWRDSSYFHPQDVELLKRGDPLKECKKDSELRVKELLTTVSDQFLQHIQENPQFWLSSGSIAMLLLGLLKSGSGEKLKQAMISVAKYLVDPNNTIEDEKEQIPLYEHAGLHMVFRKIIGHDHILEENNLTTFSEILSSVITTKTLTLWVQCNRACFLLIAMIESNVQLAAQNIKSLMKTMPVDILQNQKFPGAKILASKIKI